MVSNTDIILLSILMEKPMYGYEVEQAIKERHIRKWAAIGTSSVYVGLDRLEKKKLARSHLDSQRLPARRVYTITDNGKALLRSGAASLLCQGEYIYLDFNVGLAAYPYMNVADIHRYTTQRYHEILALIEDAERNTPTVGSVPVHAYWLWKHEYDLLRAEVAWLEEFIAYLNEK